MKVNLKKVKVFTDLKKTKSEVRDVQDLLAEFVYEHGGGFKALRLANKIADAKNGEVDLTDEEAQMVLAIGDNSYLICWLLAAMHELLDPREEVKIINSKK
jgi:hypothetical protein